MVIELKINGDVRRVECDPTRRLLDVLRDDLGIIGVKEGCGEGECGACSIFLDGNLVNSCLVPAAQAAGANIVTIEGFRETRAGRILASSFAEAHSVQCGFCTPGMMMAAGALIDRNPDPDEDEIRSSLSGNICRCTGYDMIIDGIQIAAKRIREGDQSP